MIGRDTFMNRNQYKIKCRFGIAFLAAWVTACLLSGTVFAAGNAGTGSSKTSVQSNVASGVSEMPDRESEVLSSEDWNALLNTSSEESTKVVSETTVLNSPLKSGIGKDSIFIWGCIAIGLGVLGIAFFIYSQFIYKHIKKPVEQHHAPSDAQAEKSHEVTLKRGDSFKEQTIKKQEVKDSIDTKQTEQVYTQKEKVEEPEQSGELSSTSDVNTNDIDWDQFFEDYKNQKKHDE